MGKRLLQQRRGKGSIHESLKHQSKGKARHAKLNSEKTGIVLDIITNKIHSAPLLKTKFGNEEVLLIAPEGIRVGDEIEYETTTVKVGNCLSLKDIPEGTYIYNIEKQQGDGGKFVRASGNFARVSQKTSKGITVILPSKKIKLFNQECRATIGVIAGGGRTEKPLMKAGNNFKYMKAHHKQYPKVCGISMNAVDHPFGGKCSHVKGRPMHVSRHAPAGRKVGKIAPSRTGMKR
ncbi:50S ribosomal protein L2 [Candidatus Woesearchaeota archaeon]|jgi:large subunit ribosomal protein L2|nr:50S ribosomal protein L2 [Candidatus Woesearchaeota archaeon]MBT4368718.1 50S ribosomal protein L2 [Candidatus Woesearchaeota archaeon]MBT4712007.1 50S ribosomal protein L2 [Candidatus Woesearchaeota archaeon]MBT6638902.1 50S ribosomal protein L2 [Candidatus Woesearchaeota archaeon]MBT7134546.1 50S ribosomal protein L2 [Candidatus Woesearchaeota archaeon]